MPWDICAVYLFDVEREVQKLPSLSLDVLNSHNNVSHLVIQNEAFEQLETW